MEGSIILEAWVTGQGRLHGGGGASVKRTRKQERTCQAERMSREKTGAPTDTSLDLPQHTGVTNGVGCKEERPGNEHGELA